MKSFFPRGKVECGEEKGKGGEERALLLAMLMDLLAVY